MSETLRDHGTRARYVADRCRCDRCRRANRTYVAHVSRQTAYGRWAPYVDAAPVAAHVDSLRAAGLGTRTIADRAGVDRKAVAELADRSRVRRETAAALLAVHAGLDAYAGGALVDATGTHRRLQALVAVGWPQSRLADRLGMTPSNIGTLFRADQVTAATARRVRALYDALWTGPTGADVPSPRSVARAHNHARRRGWAPPMAWDDDAIDDPAAVPAVGDDTGPRRRLPDPDELRWLIGMGETTEAIAARFGVRPQSVRVALSRAETTQQYPTTGRGAASRAGGVADGAQR